MTPRRYNLSLITANLLFGVSYSIIVSLLESKFSAQQLFIIQIVVGTMIFTPFALLRHNLKRVTQEMLPSIATYSFIILYGWSYLTLIGGESTTAIDIAALSTLGPAITIFAAAIESEKSREERFRRIYCDNQSCIYYPTLKQIKPRRIQLLALPSALLLLVFITIAHNTPVPTSTSQLIANLIITCAVICIAISTTMVKKIQIQIGTTTMLGLLFLTALLALPILIPNWLYELRAITETELSTREISGLLYLPTFGTALPLYLLYKGSIHLTPLRTALYRYLQPAIAVIVLFARQWGDDSSIYKELRHLAATLIITLLLLSFASMIKSHPRA